MNDNSRIFLHLPAFMRNMLGQIENSPVGYRLAKGMFWSLAGAAVSRGIMLVAWIVVARLLGKREYGELGMIQSTVGMFAVFTGYSLGMTATKHVAEFRQSDPQRAGRIIGLTELIAVFSGGIMTLGLFVFSSWLAEHAINAPHLANQLRISAIILFGSAVNGAQTGALAGFEAFKTIAYVNLCVGLLSFPVFIAGTYLGGLSGAVWALVINLSLNWIINRMALRKEASKFKVPFTFKYCTREWPILWKFSLPALIAGVMVGPVNWLCRAFLANRPGGYDEMGILSAAEQWQTMLLFLPGLLSSVLLPILSEQLGQNLKRQSQDTMVFAIKITGLIVIPIAIIASIASPIIMSLYGDGFRDGWPTLVIVLLTTGLVAINTPVGQIIAASGRMWIGLIMNSAWAMIFILGTLIFLDKGSFGLALARAGSYIFHTIWVFGFVRRLLKMTNPQPIHNR